MPFLIKCGGCEAKMNAPEAAAGKKVKCPKCGNIIAVPPAPPGGTGSVSRNPDTKPAKKAPPPVEEDEDEKPRPKAKKPTRDEEEPKKKASPDDVLGELSDDEQEMVRSEVKDRERIIWAGKPSVKLMVMRSLPVTIFGGIFLIASVIIFFSMRSGPAAGHDMGAMGILIPAIFAVFSLGMLTAPFWAKARAGRTFYALTSRRALVWKGGIFFGASFEEFSAMQMGNMKRQNSWMVGGAGDLVFKEEVHITTTHHSGGYRGGRRYGGGTSQSVRIVQHGFLAVPDVNEVERLIKRNIIDKLNRALDDD